MQIVFFLLKETSIVGAIAVVDLMNVTKDLIGMYYQTFESLLMLVAAYLIIILPLSMLLTWLERKSAVCRVWELVYFLQGMNMQRLFEGLMVTARIAFISISIRFAARDSFGSYLDIKVKMATLCLPSVFGNV